MANEQTFLKLLLVQLQKSQPENPPCEAQITQVTIQSRQDLDSIKNGLSAAQAATKALRDSGADSDESA